MSSDAGRPWADGENRESKLVFIGRRLPRQALLAAIADCHLPS